MTSFLYHFSRLCHHTQAHIRVTHANSQNHNFPGDQVEHEVVKHRPAFPPKECTSLFVGVWGLVLQCKVTKHKRKNTHTRLRKGPSIAALGWQCRRPEKAFDFQPPKLENSHRRSWQCARKMQLLKLRRDVKNIYMRQIVMAEDEGVGEGGGIKVWNKGREVEKVLCCHWSKCKYPAHHSCYTTQGETTHRTNGHLHEPVCVFAHRCTCIIIM